MTEPIRRDCLDCTEPGSNLARRDFFRVVGGAAALAVAAKATPQLLAEPVKPAKAVKPAESLIQELHSTLTPAQKSQIVLPFNHGPRGGMPTRLGMYNSAALNKELNKEIGQVYTKPQTEMIERIVRSITSGEDGYRQISRGGTWDASRSFDKCGAYLFGDPSGKDEYAWLFAGHHLTIRADGNFKDNVAWGGPMYYGHSPDGYSKNNIFFYQTKKVLEVFDVLDEKQRAKAIVVGSPGEQAGSVRFRKDADTKPGIALASLSNDQKELVAEVMRTILSPYRKEDADEVMSIVKANGGMDKVHLAFYRDKGAKEEDRWHFWRLEGPGFVWNYRVLPHVHCFVNIGKPIG
jgi:hypothetical protein